MAIRIPSKILRCWLVPFMALLVVLQLTACGDKELDERKAFIDYLQNTVMRSGARVPTLSEDQKQKFGRYVSDYAILVSFSQQVSRSVDASLAPLLVEIDQIRVPQDYLDKRSALQQSSGALNLLPERLQLAKNQADNAAAQLKQPDDLKVVYSQVYEKVVTQPATMLTSAVPAAVNFAQLLVQVGDYLQEQGSTVAFNNSGVQFKTEQQVTQYNGLMTNLVMKYPSLLAARKAVQQLQ